MAMYNNPGQNPKSNPTKGYSGLPDNGAITNVKILKNIKASGAHTPTFTTHAFMLSISTKNDNNTKNSIVIPIFVKSSCSENLFSIKFFKFNSFFKKKRVFGFTAPFTRIPTEPTIAPYNPVAWDCDR